MVERYQPIGDTDPEVVMKALSCVLAAAAMIVACDAATAPRSFRSTIDDSLVPEPVRAAYRDDASRLALRDLQSNGYTGIQIPSEAVQPYYDALVSVYNATALPARDTVVDVYGIHTFGNPVTRSLLLWLLGSEDWVQRLARREVPTGEPSIDTLLARYSLSLATVHVLYDGDVLVTLAPPEALNIEALAALFRGIAGVRFAQSNNMFGDGNDIDGSIEESRVLLDYSVGYGDCPAGCINRRFYHFAMDEDGTVEYLGATGSQPPELRQP
jgi:hypothetical protein